MIWCIVVARSLHTLHSIHCIHYIGRHLWSQQIVQHSRMFQQDTDPKLFYIDLSNSTNSAKKSGQIFEQISARSLLMASKNIWSRRNLLRQTSKRTLDVLYVFEPACIILTFELVHQILFFFFYYRCMLYSHFREITESSILPWHSCP